MPQRFNCEAIGAGLPVAQALPHYAQVCASGRPVIVSAPPGTGKTTLIPPAVANEVPGKVVVTIPRRVAVRAAARRLRELSPGTRGAVGVSIRGEHVEGSRVQFMTPAVLVRMLLSDPELPGVSAVVLDEVHERSLDTDLCLAMLLELRELRDDLHLSIMSATLDAQRYQDLTGGTLVEVPGVIHPVETRWAPHSGRVHGSPEFWEHVAREAAGLYGEVSPAGHSVVVFAPGAREIDALCGQLRALLDCPVLPLHGRLSAAEQEEALRPSGPRVVVASAVAESSLTVPGVRAVVDSALSRVPKRDAARGMTGLVTQLASRATMDQRRGRAGREGPGVCVRCCTEEQAARAPRFPAPEITTVDLTSATLEMACWGTPRGEGLALLDPPPALALQEAEHALRRLGAIDSAGHATDAGRRLAQLPLDPRLGSALLRCGEHAAPVLAAMSEGAAGDLARGAASYRSHPEARRLSRLAPPSAQDPHPGEVVAAVLPEWVACRQPVESPGREPEYLLASGTRAVLGPECSALRGEEWIAVAAMTRSTRPGTSGVVRAAAALTAVQAEEAVGVERRVHARLEGGRLRFREERALGAIPLSSTPIAPDLGVGRAAVEELLAAHGWELWKEQCAPSMPAGALAARLQFLHEQLGEPWPSIWAVDPSPYAAAEIERLAQGAPVNSVNVLAIMQRLLPWPEAQRLDELAPTEITLPSGRRRRVSYEDGRPVVKTKLQDCLGLVESPTVAGGVRVQFHLLSPAGRPVAVTDDLASFWAGPYAGVRAEMRGRYPKHAWPEDPLHPRE